MNSRNLDAKNAEFFDVYVCCWLLNQGVECSQYITYIAIGGGFRFQILCFFFLMPVWGGFPF